MAKMTDEEWQNLYENFETMLLLDAVGKIDEVRSHLGDGKIGNHRKSELIY